MTHALGPNPHEMRAMAGRFDCTPKPWRRALKMWASRTTRLPPAGACNTRQLTSHTPWPDKSGISQLVNMCTAYQYGLIRYATSYKTEQAPSRSAVPASHPTSGGDQHVKLLTNRDVDPTAPRSRQRLSKAEHQAIFATCIAGGAGLLAAPGSGPARIASTQLGPTPIDPPAWPTPKAPIQTPAATWPPPTRRRLHLA